MVKRTLLAMGLSLVVLLAFQMYLEKTKKDIPPEEKKVEEVKPPATGEVKSEKRMQTKRDLAEMNAFVPEGKVTPRSIKIDTSLYTAVLNTEGGGFEQFNLKKYLDKPKNGEVPVNIVGEGAVKPRPFEVYTQGADPPLPGEMVFGADAESFKLGPDEERTVTLMWRSSSGFEIFRRYTFVSGSYIVGIKNVYRNGSHNDVKVLPGIEMSQVYTGALEGDRYSFKGIVAKIGPDVKRFTLKKVSKGKGPKTFANWVALDSKYFSMGCIPSYPAMVAQAVSLGDEGIRASITGEHLELKPGDSSTFSIKTYFGPKESDILKSVGDDFSKVLDYGFFGFIAKPLVEVLKYSNSVTGNFGIDIILLTIIIKIIFHPLTQKSTRSMKKMQEIQPIIKKVQEKYKDDKARVNQEVMSLYKTYKINPLSGCMPMILQIPVFFALYKALLVAIELRHAPFMFWINDLSAPDLLFNLNVPGFTVPLRLLPLLMGASMYYQQKLNPTGGMDPTQQKMMNFLPLIFTVMFWGFPSGLVLYWLVNNVISIGQQYAVLRKGKEKEAVG